MPKVFQSFATLHTKASKKLFQISKHIYQHVGLAHSNKKTLVFIVGCQRSGTAIMRRVLGRDWRAECVPESVRAIVRTHFSEAMEPYDAAALFWFVRNSLFFEFNLAARRNILLCKYEDLALHPRQMVRRIYNFLDHPFPGDKIVSKVHAGSVGKGQHIALSANVEHLCSTLWEKLERSYQASTVSSALGPKR